MSSTIISLFISVKGLCGYIVMYHLNTLFAIESPLKKKKLRADLLSKHLYVFRPADAGIHCRAPFTVG